MLIYVLQMEIPVCSDFLNFSHWLDTALKPVIIKFIGKHGFFDEIFPSQRFFQETSLTFYYAIFTIRDDPAIVWVRTGNRIFRV